jgi:hypothetical protein
MKKKCINQKGVRLSIDWIHNLVYYGLKNKIFIFNMTDRRYEYVIEEKEYIDDLSVNPLDSILFYSTITWNGTHYSKGKIMKASQDGSNRIVLRSQNIISPIALTIDLVLRKVIWNDDNSNSFSSIDFDGNNFITFGRHNYISFYTFMQIFGDNIYWSQVMEKFIFKTKFGANDTKMNYLITSKTIEFSSFKIIDASLQPISTNRCVNNYCSHVCIPINTNEYRCICPQIKLQNDTKTCTQSVCIHNTNLLNTFLNKYLIFTTK